MQIAAETTTAEPVSPTLGWDTVFAISCAEVNKEIATAPDSYPKQITQPNAKTGLKFGFTCDCDPWQVVTGGGGMYVNILIPMKNLKATYTSKAGKAGTVTCGALNYTAQIRLDVLAHDGPAVLPDGTVLDPPAETAVRHKVAAKTTSSGPEDPVASEYKCEFVDPLSQPHAEVLLKNTILDWVNAHLDTFAHVFMFLDLEKEIATGPWAWCKPHHSSYAYCENTDTETDTQHGFIAVLSMTSKDKTPKNQEANGFAIPVGTGMAFLVHPKRFLVDLIEPALKKKWPALTLDDLEVSADGKTMGFREGVQITLPEFTADNGETYTPILTKFSIELLGNELVVRTFTDVEFDSTLGYHATCGSTDRFSLEMVKNAKGEQTIAFHLIKEDKTPGSYCDGPGEILEELLEIVGMICSVLAILGSGEVGLVFGIIAVCLLTGKYMIDQEKEHHRDDAPSLQDLLASFTGPIKWTDKDMHVTKVGLPGCLRLAGDLA